MLVQSIKLSLNGKANLFRACIFANEKTSRYFASSVAVAVESPDFSNHRDIFRGHSTVELWRAAFVLQACAVEPIVRNSQQLMHLGERWLGPRCFGLAVAPFYRQFVAGNSEEELVEACQRLRRGGVRLMLAPMLESDVGDGNDSDLWTRNLNRMVEFLRLSTVHGMPLPPPVSGGVSASAAFDIAATTAAAAADIAATTAAAANIAATAADADTRKTRFDAPVICQAKASGHFSSDIMEKLSRQCASLSHGGRVAAVQWVAAVMATVDSTNSGIDAHAPRAFPQQAAALTRAATDSSFLSSSACTALAQQAPFALSHQDLRETIAACRRIAVFGVLAEQSDVVLAVDAEFTYINPAINLITLALMSRHNTDKPLVLNTYQAYTKLSPEAMEMDRRVAADLGCCFGVKLVRGAYMDVERRWASNKGSPSPVHDTYEDTNKNYNALAAQELKNVHSNEGRCALVVATHNEESVRRALQVVATLSPLPPQYRHCWAFAQIYGMAENLSRPLASAGALVYKSVPLGTASEVLPYLSRRASENRVVLQGARRERQLLLREIRDRMLRRSYERKH